MNLVHRDVSPQNILVGIDGMARITDFGVARAATRLSSTRSGQLKGKLAYMAPEQARGGQIDRRADVFAVGIVLWEVLADKRLFKGESEADTLNRVLFEPIPKLRDIDPEIPTALEAVTMKSLDRDPEKRFPTASAFADELEKAARATSSIASVREVADYVQKVLGQDISQQREAVRAWLAQSEPSRTELDDRDIIVGVSNASSTTSSSAVSIPPKTISPTQPSSGLLSEITRARRKRRDRVLWGGAAASVAIVGGISDRHAATGRRRSIERGGIVVGHRERGCREHRAGSCRDRADGGDTVPRPLGVDCRNGCTSAEPGAAHAACRPYRRAAPRKTSARDAAASRHAAAPACRTPSAPAATAGADTDASVRRHSAQSLSLSAAVNRGARCCLVPRGSHWPLC